MANLKDLLVNGVTNHIGRNYSQTPALGTKDRQVATTEFVLDNCYKPPLLSFMWADHLLNDMSWLRADTFSWQDGTTYSSAYNKLVEEYNNSASTTVTEGSITFKRTPNGYKIALATQENAILNKYNSNGIAWYYILDTTNQRFKLPRTKFGFEGLRTSVGDDIEAGLPNITGGYSARGIENTNMKGWGALKAEESGDTISYGHDNGPGAGFNFDASRSSSIYGNSNTVQPPATQTYLYFYVGEFARNSVQQTAGLNSELFNNKLDLNANNLDNNGKSVISGLGMPSNRYIDLTLGESNTEYTAPANGFVTIFGKATNAYCQLWIINSKCNLSSRIYISASDVKGQVFVPVLKGDKFIVAYTNFSKSSFRFIYAEGEV